MQDFVCVTGMVLSAFPIGEYDRRVLILSRERGKISAFAKGARRPNSRFLAATNSFSFGQFKLYEGKNSYNIMEADISNYFDSLRNDYLAAYYGMYFLEIMDYFTRENIEETDMLKLLYQSLRALSVESLKHELIRAVFEIKAIALEGEFPGIPSEMPLSESAKYTINYVVQSSIEKLYTFTVTESVLEEMKRASAYYCKRGIDRKMKSLAILESLLL